MTEMVLGTSGLEVGVLSHGTPVATPRMLPLTMMPSLDTHVVEAGGGEAEGGLLGEGLVVQACCPPATARSTIWRPETATATQPKEAALYRMATRRTPGILP